MCRWQNSLWSVAYSSGLRVELKSLLSSFELDQHAALVCEGCWTYMVASLFGVRVVHGTQYARTLEFCDQRQNYQCCSDIGQ